VADFDIWVAELCTRICVLKLNWHWLFACYR